MGKEDRDLSGLSFALVGPGRVGTSLAHWAISRGARLDQVARRSVDLPLPWLGGTCRSLTDLTSSASDLLILAISDSALEDTAHTLARKPQAPVALHTSGRFGAVALQPLAAAGCAVGSLHPLKAFPAPLTDPTVGEGLVCAIDGDQDARAMAHRFCRSIGAIPVLVPASKRPLYHLAASLLAGGAVTLQALAREIAAEMDLDPAIANGYVDLTLEALETARADPAAGLTGPVARGDHRGYLSQLAELQNVVPSQHPVHVVLALSTIRILEKRGPLTSDQKRLRARLDALSGAPLFLDPL